MGPVVVGINAAGDPAKAELGAHDQGLPVNGMGDGLADADIRARGLWRC